jgi:retrograde regulation protein 2
LTNFCSNGIRFSISDLSAPRSRLLPCIYRERAGISLYDDLSSHATRIPPSSTPSFSKEVITLVAETVRRFKSICDDYEVPEGNIIVFATEAMRKASNQTDMLAAIKGQSGLTVDILEGGMESLFGAMGARSGFEHVDGLFMDLGGGSVQMTYMNSKGDKSYGTQSINAARSLPYGAARLKAYLQTYNEANVEELKNGIKKDMKETFEAVKEQFPQLKEQLDGQGVTIYFCGGGFRGYGSMLMHSDPIQPYPIPAIGGYTAPGHRFEDWKAVWKAHKDAKGQKIFGMSKSRREQLEGVIMVVKSIVKAVPKIKEVIFCSGGNREGVLFMKLPRHIREQTPLSLLPGGTECEGAVTKVVAQTLASILIPEMPATLISDDLMNYVVKNMYADMGDADDGSYFFAFHIFLELSQGVALTVVKHYLLNNVLRISTNIEQLTLPKLFTAQLLGLLLDFPVSLTRRVPYLHLSCVLAGAQMSDELIEIFAQIYKT